MLVCLLPALESIWNDGNGEQLGAQHLHIPASGAPSIYLLVTTFLRYLACFLAVLDDRARRQARGEASGDEPVWADVGGECPQEVEDSHTT